MGWKSIAVTCALLAGHATASVDVSALRNPDSWPSPGAPGPGRLTVDLGYAIYQGYSNTSTGVDVWKGIRFGAPPTGDLRFQAPRVPSGRNRTVTSATEFAPMCIQVAKPGQTYQLRSDEDEDCLFLNVWTPPGVAIKSLKLPVLIWIHGGGYGAGDGRQDTTELIKHNNDSFIGVQIQYRMSAFGLLSSSEVKAKGALNIWMLDQILAISWVQKYIHLFGGDPTRVTLGGQSAGAGSVMHHILADDGQTRPKPFKYAFVSSPYDLLQDLHDAPMPTARYLEFARLSGCGGASAVFECLVKADIRLVAAASNNVTNSREFGGLWGFPPVTDGVLIKDHPSITLAKKRVNGEKIFVGHTALEDTTFPIPGINTKDRFVGLVKQAVPVLNYYPNITNLLDLYSPTFPIPPNTTFETNGLTGATANDVSGIAAGYQQTTNNMIGEVAFVCPAYWLAGAFTQSNKTAFQYQYSVPIAHHAADTWAYFGTPMPNQGQELADAMMAMVGSFINTGNPSISRAIANGPSATDPTADNDASNWPAWTSARPAFINMNTTGGTPVPKVASWGTGIQFIGPGLRNYFRAADAYPWEGGRGKRCDFWRDTSRVKPAG